MQMIRIIEIPACRMVSSGRAHFGDPAFDRFDRWFSQLPRGPHPRDFLFEDDGYFHWLYIYEPGMDVPDEFPIIDFPGGLYAVATDIDQQTDALAMQTIVDAFLATHGFRRDPDRAELGNVITPPAAVPILGFQQMDYYTPILPRT